MTKYQVFKTLSILAFSLFFNSISYAEPTNLAIVVKEVKAYHDTGAYQTELTQAIHRAHDYILKKVQANQQKPDPQKLAVVLDIDETSLSNYDRMVTHDFVGNKTLWHKAILAADAPPIKPMLSLYQDALRHGVTVFFVTGRNETERQATEKNLLQAGYKGWKTLYFRPIDYHQPSIVTYKSQARATIEKQGYTIIATIGDQRSDIIGGYAEKGFKLPNPYYYLP